MNSESIVPTPTSIEQKINTKQKHISLQVYTACSSRIAGHSSSGFLAQQTAIFSSYFHLRTEKWPPTKSKMIPDKVLNFV